MELSVPRSGTGFGFSEDFGGRLLMLSVFQKIYITDVDHESDFQKILLDLLIFRKFSGGYVRFFRKLLKSSEIQKIKYRGTDRSFGFSEDLSMPLCARIRIFRRFC